MTEQEWLNDNQLSLDIWYKKYQVDNESFEHWLDRVSGGNQDIRQLILEKKFLFGGRILAGRGLKENKVTLSNCFVIPSPQDNLESIFETGKMMAKTFSRGGGCGINVSHLRPEGAITHNAARESTGPTSFMEFYSYITGLISQHGRRGATMICMDCKHPDIEKFINLKTKQGVCEKANISVMVSDEFMEAVIQDKDWVTEFTSEEVGTITKTFKARDLLRLLAKRNWEWAEPGILYWDRIIHYNMNDNNPDFKITATNPCGELPLQDGGACLLGSLNLSEFVVSPFTDKASINWEELGKATQIAVVGLNEALDENIDTLPLEVQRKTACNWRAIGLGTMGLADMLIKLGITYGSEEAILITEKLYKFIVVMTIQASIKLAANSGCYPMCNKEKLVESSFIKSLNLPEDILHDIRVYGLRNAQLLTCAPTGSIATMLQVSTGVEPNFALKYTRKTQSLNGKDTYYEVFAKIVDDYIGDRHGEDIKLPDYFIESKDIAPIDRIKMQGALQKWIDNSISSTINLPKEATVEDVYNIYVEAWKYGLKGTTVNCMPRQNVNFE